jgi:hypothetical protein
MIEESPIGVGVDQVGEIDEQEEEEAPADESVHEAGQEAGAEDGLERSHFGGEFDDPLPDQRPGDLALSAADVFNDAFHAAISKVKRNEDRDDEENFLGESKHGSSEWSMWGCERALLQFSTICRL